MALNQNNNRVPVKGNCVESGPSLLAETIPKLLFRKTGYRMQNTTIPVLWVSTFLVEYGVPPAGGPTIVSQTPSYSSSYAL